MSSDTTLVLLFPFTHFAPVYPAVGTWWPGVNWESNQLSCNINHHLTITGEANAQLSFCVKSLWNSKFYTFTCETWTVLLQVSSPAPGGFTAQGLSVQVVPGIPVLFHRVAIAMLWLCYGCHKLCCTLRAWVFVCMCAYMHVGLYACMPGPGRVVETKCPGVGLASQ